MVYETRAAVFTGFASRVFGLREKRSTEWLPEHTWWRPPYTASFRAGNFDFVVVAAHVRRHGGGRPATRGGAARGLRGAARDREEHARPACDRGGRG